MTYESPSEIHVRPDGNLCMVGAGACMVYLSTDWVTGEPMAKKLRSFLTNPNYGPGSHPFWVQKRGAHVSLLPAEVAEGETPDLILHIPDDVEP